MLESQARRQRSFLLTVSAWRWVECRRHMQRSYTTLFQMPVITFAPYRIWFGCARRVICCDQLTVFSWNSSSDCSVKLFSVLVSSLSLSHTHTHDCWQVKAKLELAGGGYAKVRLPFPREVTERKAVKEVLVSRVESSRVEYCRGGLSARLLARVHPCGYTLVSTRAIRLVDFQTWAIRISEIGWVTHPATQALGSGWR